MTGIQDAQARWQVVRSKGRTKGIIALVVVLAVVFAIGLLAGKNSTTVAIGVIALVVVVAVIAAVIGKQKTGLSLTPEWKPETVDDFDDDFDDDLPDSSADATSSADQTTSETDPETTEPVRRLDAQILGVDLSKLGQVVSPKLAKSYAVGTLVLEGPAVVWEPGAGSRADGIESLSVDPAQVASVDMAPLWGSWALVRVGIAEGDEWCLRVPGSVDLAPAFAEMGLTLRRVS